MRPIQRTVPRRSSPITALHSSMSKPTGPSRVCCDIFPELLRLERPETFGDTAFCCCNNDSSHLRLTLVHTPEYNLVVHLYDAQTFVALLSSLEAQCRRQSVSTSATAAAVATATAEVGAAADAMVPLALGRRHALCSNSDLIASFIQ